MATACSGIAVDGICHCPKLAGANGCYRTRWRCRAKTSHDHTGAEELDVFSRMDDRSCYVSGVLFIYLFFLDFLDVIATHTNEGSRKRAVTRSLAAAERMFAWGGCVFTIAKFSSCSCDDWLRSDAPRKQAHPSHPFAS